MKRLFSSIFGFFHFSLVIVLFGCGGGGYRDEALLGQAKRSLNRIKNSLEQYWVEKGSYPPEGADLGERLEKFVEGWEDFVTESFSQGPIYLTPDSLTAYFIEVKAKDRWETPLVIRVQREAKETGENPNEE